MNLNDNNFAVSKKANEDVVLATPPESAHNATVNGVAWSYSGVPETGELLIHTRAVDVNTGDWVGEPKFIGSFFITKSGYDKHETPGLIVPLRTSLIFTLKAGGAGIKGTLTILK